MGKEYGEYEEEEETGSVCRRGESVFPFSNVLPQFLIFPSALELLINAQIQRRILNYVQYEYINWRNISEFNSKQNRVCSIWNCYTTNNIIKFAVKGCSNGLGLLGTPALA